MNEDLTEQVLDTTLWERLAALGSVLLLAVIAWIGARWLMRQLHGKSRLGIHGLERLAAPVALLLAVAAGVAGLLPFRSLGLPLLKSTLGFMAIASAFWLVARLLDVIWASGRNSARLRADPTASAVLLAGRRLGKVVVTLIAVAVLSVRLGATEQLYLALGAIGAALAFAARDPIRDVFAFIGFLLDPPFHLGDRVRMVDFRGGEACVGEVVRMALTSVSVRTSARTLVVVPNAKVVELRVENLSSADRRRLELSVSVDPAVRADALRDACDAVEKDLRASSYVTDKRAPRVWIAGFGEGLRIKVSVWLRRAADRREAQRELLLGIRSRLPPPASRGG